MAAIAASQITQMQSFGGAERETWYRISNVTTGDTLDTGAIGPTLYNRLDAAPWCPGGGGGGGAKGGVVGALSNGAAGVNNKVTFTLTSMAQATISVLLQGAPQ